MINLRWGKRKKVGLALGGGVARGLAHIGVLKALKKENIPIDFVAGTSSGSVFAALFAFGIDPEYMEGIASENIFDLFKVTFNQINPFGQDAVAKLIENEIGKSQFEDSTIPLFIVAQDIRTGEKVVLKHGRVSRAVSASCAFPGIFNPQKIDGRTLIDGGGIDNLPVAVLVEAGAEIKIAVDVLPGQPLKKEPSNPIKIMGRAIDLAIKKMSQAAREQADILIDPDIPPEIWHTDFKSAAALIKLGELAVRSKISELKKLL